MNKLDPEAIMLLVKVAPRYPRLFRAILLHRMPDEGGPLNLLNVRVTIAEYLRLTTLKGSVTEVLTDWLHISREQRAEYGPLYLTALLRELASITGKKK